MTAAWTVKTGNGQLLAEFAGASPIEVGRRIVSARYDAFRLQVSSSYRQMFERDVQKVLAREGWQIVKTRSRAPKSSRCNDLAIAA